MEFNFIPIITFLMLGLVATDAALYQYQNPEGTYHVNLVAENPLPNEVFAYNHAIIETQSQNNPNVSFYFSESDLHQGTKFKLSFTKTSNAIKLLSRHIAAESIFSSNNEEPIVDKFSTIKEEEKVYVNSLHSMVDFTTSKFGKNALVVSTIANKETGLEEYTIVAEEKILGKEKIACQKTKCPYAIFSCQKKDNIEAHSLLLEGVDGNRVRAIAMCHTDTSQWNPNHLAFQVLKVQPGTTVCHFLPQDDIVWIPI